MSQQSNEVLAHARLKLNIEHPELSDVWVEGYEAVKAQLEEEANPYTLNSPEYFQWTEGWWAGFYEEEPVYAVDASTDASVQSLHHNAANESSWATPEFKRWAGRIVRVAGAIAVSVACYELLDMAI